MKKALVLLSILSFTGFSYGCTAAGRKEILDEALGSAKAFVLENGKELGKSLLTSSVDAAREYVDAKLKAKEASELKELDAHLAIHKTVDAEGVENTKTWKDFDSDKSGSLEEGELAKVAAFITTMTARKAASGEMSKDEAGKHAKSTGITLAALMAILLGKRAVGKFAKKTPPPGTPAPPGGTA